MARIITAGFESGLFKEELNADSIFTIGTTGSPDIQTAKTKSGSYALKVASGENIELFLPVYSGPFFWKFWFLRVSVGEHTNRVLWRAESSAAGFHARIFLNSAGKLVEEHNNSNADSVTGTTVIADNVWYEIRIEYFGDEAPNGYVKIWVDGNLDIDDTSIDTQDFSFQQRNQHIAGAQTGYDFYYDDIFLNDDQGSDNNTNIDFQVKLAYFSPTANGFTTDFVPDPSTSNHYENVDEIPYNLSPSTGDSLDGGSVADVELLVTPNVSPVITSLADIKNINIFTATWINTGTTMRASVRVGAVTYNSSVNLANAGGVAGVHSNRWMTNPATAAIWTASEVDAIEIGAIIITVTANTGDIHAIGLYIEYVSDLDTSILSKAGLISGNRVFPTLPPKHLAVDVNIRKVPKVYP